MYFREFSGVGPLYEVDRSDVGTLYEVGPRSPGDGSGSLLGPLRAHLGSRSLLGPLSFCMVD